MAGLADGSVNSGAVTRAGSLLCRLRQLDAGDRLDAGVGVGGRGRALPLPFIENGTMTAISSTAIPITRYMIDEEEFACLNSRPWGISLLIVKRLM